MTRSKGRRWLLVVLLLAGILAVVVWWWRFRPPSIYAQETVGASAPAAGASPVQPQGASFRLLRDARVGNNRVAVLVEDLLYCYPPSGDLIIVPASYVTDFASVPGGADRFLEEYGGSIEAAIVHDWLYAVGEAGRRRYADDLFRYALLEQGVSISDRWLKWLGVTAGGGSAYGRDSEWTDRFYLTNGQGPIAPPFLKPMSAIVGTVDSCAAMESYEASAVILNEYGSYRWPRPPA